MQSQSKRYENLAIDSDPNPYGGYKWIMHGLLWGLSMFVLIALIARSIEGEDLIKRRVIIDFIWWMGSGLVFGYVLKLVNRIRLKEAIAI